MIDVGIEQFVKVINFLKQRNFVLYYDLFDGIISLENLFLSWKKFRRGKHKKNDVQIYKRHLEDNLFSLYMEFKNKTYRHSNYTSFYITDPKVRHIHKACVKDELLALILRIEDFLEKHLKLKLHPDKIIIRKLNQGIDFLGYEILPHCRVLRTKTKRRMVRRINDRNLSSYLGLLKHCNGYKLRREIYARLTKNQFFC